MGWVGLLLSSWWFTARWIDGCDQKTIWGFLLMANKWKIQMVSPILKHPGNFQDQMVLVYGLEPYLCAFGKPSRCDTPLWMWCWHFLAILFFAFDIFFWGKEFMRNAAEAAAQPSASEDGVIVLSTFSWAINSCWTNEAHLESGTGALSRPVPTKQMWGSLSPPAINSSEEELDEAPAPQHLIKWCLGSSPWILSPKSWLYPAFLCREAVPVFVGYCDLL